MALAVGGEFSRITATATDTSGNLYLAGTFYRQITFGSTTLIAFGTTPTVGAFGTFLAKWNTATQRYTWAQSIGQGGVAITGVAVSGSSIYATGLFSYTVQFGSITLTNNNQAPSGPTATPTSDAFVAKMTDTGVTAAFMWAQQVSGAGEDSPTAIAVNGNNVYITGFFGYQRGYGSSHTPTRFGNITLPNAGDINVFIARLTDAGGSGTFIWAQSGGGTFEDYATAIAVKGASIYVTGYCGSPAFAMDGFTLTNNSNSKSAFIIKLTDTGNAAAADWLQQGAESSSAQAIAVNGSSIYITGNSGTGIFGTIPFDSSKGTIFIAKLADAGGSAHFSWVQSAGYAFGGQRGNALVVDGSAIYVGGIYRGGSFGTTTLPTTGGADVFIAKLVDVGAGGDFSWAQRAGSTFEDEVTSLALVGTSLYVAGRVGNTGNFGPYAIGNASGSANAYLAWSNISTVTATTSPLATANINLYPCPAHDRATVQLPPIPGVATATLTVLDALGRTLRTQTAATNAKAELNLTGLPAGVYAVRVQAGQQVATQRLVVE